MSEYYPGLLKKEYTPESWQALALHLYDQGEYEKCYSLLQECVERYKILDGTHNLKIETATITIWMLNILELNMALGSFETNTRRSETLVRNCEERLEQFSKAYGDLYSGNHHFVSGLHKCKGYIYLYKNSLMTEVDLQQRDKFLNKSEEEFKEALRANSNDIQTISGMANVLYQKRLYSQSLRLFSLILLLLGSSKCPNTVRLGMASCYLRLGRPKRASECCKRGIYLLLSANKTNSEKTWIGSCSKDSNDTTDRPVFKCLFPDTEDVVVNTDFFKSGAGEELIGKMSKFDRQTLSDLLICLYKTKEAVSDSRKKNIARRDELFRLVNQVCPSHPALLIYRADAEFFALDGEAERSTCIEKSLLRMSKRGTNFYFKLRSRYQIARKQHRNLDYHGASQNYTYIVNSMDGVNKNEQALLETYLSSLYGLIKINIELQKWDMVYQYTQAIFEAIGIRSSGDLNLLRDYSLPVGYLYEIAVITISFVIISIENKTNVPRNISVFSQLTVEERLSSCLHYLFFLLDRILMDSRDEKSGESDGNLNGSMVYLLLHKVILALLFRGRKSLRRTDYDYKSVSWLISTYTTYKDSLSPVPLVVLLSACLNCMLKNKGEELFPQQMDGGQQAEHVLRAFPDLKCRQFVRDNFGLYCNNLGVCILECVTSIAIEHNKLGDEQALLGSAQRLFSEAKEWLLSKRNSADEGEEVNESLSFAEVAIRFNSAICNELSGNYANANDEYKKLSQEYPWFTASWLRRASLALERSDFQLAAQYCEISLNSKHQYPGQKSSHSANRSAKQTEYAWAPGMGTSPEAASLLLAYIYSRQKKMEKSFLYLSKVVKCRNPQFSNIGKIFLGMALYNKAKSSIQTYNNSSSLGDGNIGIRNETGSNSALNQGGGLLMNNPSSVQSRMILSEVLRHETYNYIASNLMTIQAAESGLVEASMELWKHMLDVSGALEGTAVAMNYLSLVNLGILNAVLLTISTQRHPPPTQHNLTLSLIVDENNSNIDRKNEVLGSHPNFAEQRRILKSTIKLFQQALSLNPNEKILHLSLIRCCFDMNLWEDARRLLEKATIRWPSDITFRIGLTYCLERLIYSEMGDMERAKHPGRVKYWMMLCEAVGNFYHWLSILKETFQIVDMNFIDQVRFNKLSIQSLQKYVPGFVKHNQETNNIAKTTENKDEYRYRLCAFPPEGVDLLPSKDYLTKQELIVSRKLRSRFEELLPIVEQVYEKEQRDAEELRMKNEDFMKKMQEESRKREEEERANREKVKLLSLELGREAESIAATLLDPGQSAKRPRVFSKRDASDDNSDESSDGSSSSGDSGANVHSDSESEPDSESESEQKSSETESDSASLSKSKSKSKHSKPDKSSKGSEAPRVARNSKREEKRLLKLRRLREQTAAMLEMDQEQKQLAEKMGDEGSRDDRISTVGAQVKSRLKKKRRLENEEPDSDGGFGTKGSDEILAQEDDSGLFGSEED